jgi:hypothetical protein
VTLISPENESVTIQMDTQTHLPLRRTFEWRDPLYKDKNTRRRGVRRLPRDGGFPTPFTITRFKNDDRSGSIPGSCEIQSGTCRRLLERGRSHPPHQEVDASELRVLACFARGNRREGKSRLSAI